MTERIIRGNVNADGSREEGSGFQVTPLGSGEYYIDFEPSFNSVPTIVATQNFPNWDGEGVAGFTTDNVVIVSVTENNAILKTGGHEGDPMNRNFCFIAIGE